MRKLTVFLLTMLLLASLVCTASADDELPYGLPKLDITGDTVTYLTWDSQKTLETNAANLLMQKVYGCKIKVVRTTYAEIAQKAATMVLSGNAPDLIKYRNQEFPRFITTNVAADVTDMLDFSDPLWADLKDTADFYQYQGRYFVFPCGKIYNNNIIYYYTSYFEDLGLETPKELYEQGEWTVSRMRELMKELRQDEDRDGVVDIYGLVLHPIYSYVCCGEDYVIWDPDTGLFKNNLRSPALADYYDFIYETSSAGDDSRLMSLEDIACFNSKDAVMLWGERWLASTYYDQIMSGEIDMAPPPRMDGTDEYYTGGRIDVFWLGQGSSNPNGALAYMACQRAIAQNEGLARELLEEAGQTLKEWPEEYKAFFDEIDAPEKFTMIIPKAAGVGNWGNDNDGMYDLYSISTQFEWPWNTVVEKHYPILQEQIDITNQGGGLVQ